MHARQKFAILNCKSKISKIKLCPGAGITPNDSKNGIQFVLQMQLDRIELPFFLTYSVNRQRA